MASAELELGFPGAAYNNTLIFDKVMAYLSADTITDPTGDIGFSLALDGAKNVLTVDLEFEVDSILYDLNVQGLNGFNALAGSLTWNTLGNGKYKGAVTLGYYQGNSVIAGFSAVGKADIAKFIYSAKSTGTGDMTLTSIAVNGLDQYNNQAVALPAGIGGGKATSYIYSSYDLNKDGRVSSLDLACVLLYVEFRSNEAAWNSLIKVVDNYGNPIYPSMCDFIEDGVVNMLDLIDLMLHYS